MEEGGKNGTLVDEKTSIGDRSNNNSEEVKNSLKNSEEVKNNVHKHTRLSLRSLSMNRSDNSPAKNGRKTSRDRTSKLESNKSLSSLNSQDSLGESDSPNKTPGGRFYKAVRIGRGTRNLLDKWKSQSKDAEPSAETSSDGDHIPAGGSKKNSSAENSEEVVDPVKKSSWSEHVWSTFIHRGFSDDVTENKKPIVGKDLLTEFQKDKFKYFFYHVLDLNTDHVISIEDFLKLNDRIKHYMDWSVNTLQFLALKEVHGVFLEYFLSTAAILKASQGNDGDWDPFPQAPQPELRCCVTIEEWLDVWGATVGNARKINDFPMWLQYYPKILFDTINRSGSGKISKNELQLFYTAFLDVGTLGEKKIEVITEKAYAAMTANGDVILDFHIYKLSFLNFLLGKQPNGPGQFIFGTVTPASGSRLFTVDYSALTVVDNEDKERGKECFTPDLLAGGGDRKSIIV